MSDSRWNHEYLDPSGVRVHYVRHGAGFPLVLLHGWPEFWYVYRQNIPALAEGFDVVAPDLRGFGDSGKTPLPDRPSDLLGELVEALGFGRFGWSATTLVPTWHRGSRGGIRGGSPGCSFSTVRIRGSLTVGWSRGR